MAVQSGGRPRWQTTYLCEVQRRVQEVPPRRNQLHGAGEDERDSGGLPQQEDSACCHHMSSLLQRLVTTGHERRGLHCGTERAEDHQRAHRRSHRIRHGQEGVRREKCINLRLGRWHLRRVSAEYWGRDLRGEGHRRRHPSGRGGLRLQTSRVLCRRLPEEEEHRHSQQSPRPKKTAHPMRKSQTYPIKQHIDDHWGGQPGRERGLQHHHHQSQVRGVVHAVLQRVHPASGEGAARLVDVQEPDSRGGAGGRVHPHSQGHSNDPGLLWRKRAQPHYQSWRGHRLWSRSLSCNFNRLGQRTDKRTSAFGRCAFISGHRDCGPSHDRADSEKHNSAHQEIADLHNLLRQ